MFDILEDREIQNVLHRACDACDKHPDCKYFSCMPSDKAVAQAEQKHTLKQVYSRVLGIMIHSNPNTSRRKLSELYKELRAELEKEAVE